MLSFEDWKALYWTGMDEDKKQNVREVHEGIDVDAIEEAFARAAYSMYVATEPEESDN